MDSKDNKQEDVTSGGFGVKVDSIFEEVEKNLPSVDFDNSDVSSDEDVAIFQRTIKTPTFDEDKDFDESLTNYTWHDVLGSDDLIPDNDVIARRIQSGVTDSLTTYNDVPSDVSTVSLRSIREDDHETESAANKNSQTKNSEKVFTSSGTSTSGDFPEVKPKVNAWTQEEEAGGEAPELSPPEGERKEEKDKNRKGQDKNRKEEKREKRGVSSRELVSMYIPKAPPALTFQDLDNVDLDAALVGSSVGSLIVSPPSSQRPQPPTSLPRTPIGNVVIQDDDDDNTVSLIEKLARLSVAQSGHVMKEYNDVTGAVSTLPEVQENRRPASAPTPGTKAPTPGTKTTTPGTKAEKTAKNRDMEAQQRSHSSLAMHRPSRFPTTVAPPLTPDPAPSTSGVPYGEGFMSQLTPPITKKPEPKTVYIDLRNFDVEKHQQQMSFEAVQRILKLPPTIQPEPDSSSDDEDDGVTSLTLWHEQRRQMKEAFRTGKPVPVVTNFKTSKLTKSEEKLTHNEEGTPVAESTEPVAGTGVETKPLDKAVAITDLPNKPSLPSPTHDNDKQRRVEAAKKAREARDAEHHSRLRLEKRIKALRPERTPSDRHATAHATPAVFDLEASYEPAPQSLPSDMADDRDVLLLTVHMSSDGEIVLHRGSTNRSVDSGHGLSASYTTLVTWILSLVPDNFTFLTTPPGVSSPDPATNLTPPFKVLGLQQMVLEDQMALYIAVCPREPISDQPSKSKRGKKKDDFSSVLTKYLSINTLHSVSPWLHDLVSMEVTSPLSDHESRFIYRPPLPNITTKPLSTFIQVTGDLSAVYKVFGLPLGFFWYTVETDESVSEVEVKAASPSSSSPHDPDHPHPDHDVQNTMSLIYKRIYRDPRAMMGILNRILQEGLDLAGLRLLYPTPALMSVAAGNPSPRPPNPSPSTTPTTSSSSPNMLNNIGPILALAVRGTFARTLWLDAIGPADPILARRIDPNSLCALYGGSTRDECLLFCPRNPERIQTELVRWFGGRVPSSGVVNVGVNTLKKKHNSGAKRGKAGKSTEPDSELLTHHNPPAMLTTTIDSDILLLVSPLVPPRTLGLVLATCQRRGYQLRGVRRQRLSTKRASSLGMDSHQVSVFAAAARSSSPSSSTLSDPTLVVSEISPDLGSGDAPIISPRPPTTTLLLRKENALHSAASLIENLMVQLCLSDRLGPIQDQVSQSLTSCLLFHTLPYTESYMNVLGRDFSKVPETDRVVTPGYIAPKLYTNPEMEQVAVLTLTGHSTMKNFGLTLGRLLGVVPLSKASPGLPVAEGFELLGIKWLPSLSLQHAKELTPHEVGDSDWRPSIQALTSEPAVVIALRGVNAFQRLDSFLKSTGGGGVTPSSPRSLTPSRSRGGQPSLDRLLSSTADGAYRQIALFFWDHELFPDNSARKMLLFLPPPAGQGRQRDGHGPPKSVTSPVYEESIFQTMMSGARPIITVLVAKPGVVRRSLGKLMKRINHEGFNVVGLRLEVLSELLAARVIPPEDQENEVLRGMHVTYLTSGPSLVFCLQRENAIYRLQQILGPTDPQKARRLGQHFWRAIFGSDAISNGLYGSRDYRSALDDVRLFFPEGLACHSNPDLDLEGITCPVEDAIIDDSLSRPISASVDSPVTPLPVATTRSSGTMPVDWRLPISSLTETNCIVLMPALTKQQTRSKKADYVNVIDALLSNGFDLVAARSLWFTESQAMQYLCLLNAGSFQLVPSLVSGPSLVLALQRDNAVIAFDALLGSTYVKDSVYSKYGGNILRPKDGKQAKKHLSFFFDKLSPGAQLQISLPDET